MIPKVAGYSGFNSYGGLPYSSLKPGQTKLDRDYYKDANKVNPDGKTYLGTFSRFGSNHQHTVDKTVKPSDYKSVNRSGKQNLNYEYLHNPELFNYTKQGRLAATQNNFNNDARASTELRRAASTNISGPSNTMYKTTSHWISNYRDESIKTTTRPASQSQRPFWSYPKRHHVSRKTAILLQQEKDKPQLIATAPKDQFFVTENQYNYQKKLNRELDRLENDVNELTIGSTKVTSHIPGYSGFMVRTNLNEAALTQSKNQNGRDLMKSKVNMNENFNVKIPGYSGYKPLSCLNDRGSVRPQLFSTQGEKFF